ncbi:hypothetical protein HGRIS_013143 [Hohenbuehelia grisea]|uniref:AAA+ ATPase domain-containing protein n=1 Tax=Hohenbuehelia grisea TaxID=104357 RepID=A0ABR3IUP3_9AGAR
MRSQNLFRRSRSLLKLTSAPRNVCIAASRPPRAPRTESVTRPTAESTGKRLSSSTSSGPAAPSNPSDEPPSSSAEPPPSSQEPDAPPEDEPDKPRTRRTRISISATKDAEPPQLPEGLDIIWTPESAPDPADGDASALPPPEIFEEALHNLHIALQPQTQHRATYGTSIVEPNIALYCPIEGGDYVLDATVRELGRRTGADILVLDAVQLAAGEWGHFGKAADALQLPRNPLHFTSVTPAPSLPSRGMSVEEEDEETPAQMYSSPQQMTLTLMTSPSAQGRTVLGSSSRRTPAPSKSKVFFDALVNIPSPESPEVAPPHRKPRIVYVRDFQTLASTSATWYPPLVSAVRQRRRGPMARPSSPIPNPMVIIFGVTPSLAPAPPRIPNNGPGGGVMGFLMNRNHPSPQFPRPSKPGKFDWSEGDVADQARERRLRDRLKRWESNDPPLLDDIPTLRTSGDDSGEPRPDVIVVGGPQGIPLPPPMFTGLGGIGREDSPGGESGSAFFRTSILVPRMRSLLEERNCRVNRRREINEVTMRMGVGAVGGTLQDSPHSVEGSDPSFASEQADDPTYHLMWEDWGKRIETWATVRQIADRAVGSTVNANFAALKTEKPTLEPTHVSWQTLQHAWVLHRSMRSSRKTWMKEAILSKGMHEHEEEDADAEGADEEIMDEIVERVKQEGDLDPHEQRLLPSIVDAASMPTSFSQVHLPDHTIDSVRTIVSLPLLHPAAFQQGILKEHGMTGCLLFGPPGTGKTLVVRALAKEAGCRMMVISPSDVMDMYVGEGEKLVRAVFSLARRLSPCVVFLDEIDALFGARMSARESGGAFAHRGVITEFMQEMDGLKSSKENSVIVIGATNRPFDLDDAILRRLPRRLLIDLPGEKEREEILKILLRDETLDAELDIKALAKKTDSFSGSDLKHLCVSAALDAVKENVQLPWSSSTPAESLSTEGPSSTVDAVAEDLQSSSTVAEDNPAESSTQSEESDSPSSETMTEDSTPPRSLHLRNFEKALKEITPSSSEVLGSLVDLRKWNEEFGEGRKNRKRIHVWGKDRFGFTNKIPGGEDARVVIPTPSAAAQIPPIDSLP